MLSWVVLISASISCWVSLISLSALRRAFSMSSRMDSLCNWRRISSVFSCCSISALALLKLRLARPSHSAAVRMAPGSRSGPSTRRATVAVTNNSRKPISNIGPDLPVLPVAARKTRGLLVLRVFGTRGSSRSAAFLALVAQLFRVLVRRFVVLHGAFEALEGAAQVRSQSTQFLGAEKQHDDQCDD